jgi:hypothetical protein
LPNGWVFFHFDGDRPWSASASSENRQKFKELNWEPVRLKIQERLVERKREMATRTEEVKSYDTRKAIRLCQERYGGRDVEQFQAWAQDRTALEEVLKPKEAVCLGAAHNLELAWFPTREVRAAGRSFAAIVEVLSQDSALREALAQTYAYG